MAVDQLKPTVKTNDRNDGEILDHPAFGAVSIRRQSTRGHNLFMSNIPHSEVFILEIDRASMDRRLNQDSIFPIGDPVVRVAMTPAQLGEMMGSAASGRQVPCTLERIANERVPYIEAERTTKRFGREASEKLAAIRAAVARMVPETDEKLQEAKVSGKRREDILSTLTAIQGEIESGLPFMLEQFYATLEGMVDEARAQATSFMTEDQIAHTLLGRPKDDDSDSREGE
jgi:hypothetical protein